MAQPCGAGVSPAFGGVSPPLRFAGETPGSAGETPAHYAGTVNMRNARFACRRKLVYSLSVMVLVIDNYDSFTYNLVQYLGEMKVDLQVHRNDQITLEQIRQLKPERILISPGP